MKQEALAILEELGRYNDKELFFRRCYELRNDRTALKVHLKSISRACLRNWKYDIESIVLPVKANGMNQLFPASDRSSIKTRKLLFPKRFLDRNVFLRKHDRYNPVFVHCHEFFEIFYCLSGGCVSTIGGERISFHEGSLCFIPPLTYHTMEVFDDSIVITVVIRKSNFDVFGFDLLTADNLLGRFFTEGLYSAKSGQCIIIATDKDNELRDMIFDMLVEQKTDDPFTSRIMENQIKIFLFLALRRYGDKAAVEINGQSAVKNKHMDMIMYINENFRTLSLVRLARHFNLETSYCSRLIKAVTGKTYKEIVRDNQMRFAKHLLQNSDMRIYEISYSLGFGSQENFIRTFKKTCGKSPTAYRQQYRHN
ncbi:MAG: AraC family transcriptional regulator [Treponema sp.]|jgi:AraC-like DNA-binding protein/mannose-6-phosphate isomerase-like protein (cupin superfamily)|nr:AraC family transcriptional regulator [Treponema sp.]